MEFICVYKCTGPQRPVGTCVGAQIYAFINKVHIGMRRANTCKRRHRGTHAHTFTWRHTQAPSTHMDTYTHAQGHRGTHVLSMHRNTYVHRRTCSGDGRA